MAIKKLNELDESATVSDSDIMLLQHENGSAEKIGVGSLFEKKGGSKPILVTRAQYDALGDDYKRDNIYVITDENVTGITVDQTYNATSGNPQSGKAVAEGLENALDDYYTKDEIKGKLSLGDKTEVSSLPFTATSDGFLLITIIPSSSGNYYDYYYINDVVENESQFAGNTGSGWKETKTLIVKKGDTIKNRASQNVGSRTFKFIPLNKLS